MWTKIKLFFYRFARPFRLFWSNLYWRRKKSRYNVPIREEDKIKKGETINKYIDRATHIIMDTFEYTHDGIDQLGDTTPPPPEIYAQFKEGSVWKDDCDGYHSCLYHLAYENGIMCDLISILSLNNKYGHCVLGYIDEKGNYHIQDYLTNHTGASFEDIIREDYIEVTGGALIWFKTDFDYNEHLLYNIKVENNFMQKE